MPRTTAEKAFMLLQAARNDAARRDKVHLTYQCANRLEQCEIHVHAESAYADPGENAEPVVAVGNWNAIDTYDRLTQKRVEISNLTVHLSRALEKLGVPCEWSDEWSTCGDCGRLIRTSADSHDWEPYYVHGDGEITCLDCLDIESYLESLQGQTDDQVPSSIDPTEHGYVLCDPDDEDGTPETSLRGRLRELGRESYIVRRERWRYKIWISQADWDAAQVEATCGSDD